MPRPVRWNRASSRGATRLWDARLGAYLWLRYWVKDMCWSSTRRCVPILRKWYRPRTLQTAIPEPPSVHLFAVPPSPPKRPEKKWNTVATSLLQSSTTLEDIYVRYREKWNGLKKVISVLYNHRCAWRLHRIVVDVNLTIFRKRCVIAYSLL